MVKVVREVVSLAVADVTVEFVIVPFVVPVIVEVLVEALGGAKPVHRLV